jgi:predicted dehydrogenase
VGDDDDDPTRLRVAVVGLGIGQLHVHGYTRRRDLFEVVAVCDTDRCRAEPVAERLRGVRVADDVEAVAAAEDVDVVSLCTPPFLHREQVEVLLRGGKHVVCEKPLVGSLREVDELAAIEGETGARVMPVFQYRYGHGLQKLRHLVLGGLAGKAYATSVDVAWQRGPGYYEVPWRGRHETELGGVLLSHCVHALDMATYVLGEPRSGFARIATRVNAIETEDCASASIELTDGSFLTLSATLGSAVEVSQHRFCFEHLTAESNREPYDNASDPWDFVATDDELQPKIDAALSGFERHAEGYQRQFELLHAALTGGGELPVTLADARRSIGLVSALYHSARTGASVALPLGADHS